MVRKVKKKYSGIRIFITFLLIVVLSAIVLNLIITLGNRNVLEGKHDEGSAPDSLSGTEIDSSVIISPDKLNSPNLILIRLNDQATLLGKNIREKIYPASLTKMMTAIVAIENLPDLEVEIRLTDSIFRSLYEANASLTGFLPGEEVRAIDLLYGAMLSSGAESCIGLAEYIADSEKGFAELMNQKAADLGMDNTHFVNTTGLHDKKHYTTVEDLAILLNYSLQNDTFRKIFTASRYSTKSTNKHPDGITCHSTMFKKLSNYNIIGGEILGGKTGYTSEAGLCLASLAKVDDNEYILISAGAEGDHQTEQYNITDALVVYNSIASYNGKVSLDNK